ncbi:hypothetical protein ACEN19_00030 [Corynebacterium auriscanis]|uniref:hypothetical protein n=1 Tax=Corynebacterium auriscanis TaxID=99807 RepID=UPI003CF09618
MSNILGVRGDGVVRISAREPFARSGVVVIDDWDDVAVKAGRFTAEVQPGQARFHVIVGSTSHVFEVAVPESGETTLADMIVNDYPYEPQVVSQVGQAARDAAASAGAAKASENQALAYRDSASEAAGAAALSVSSASESKTAAAASASAARASETKAKTSETNAKTSETNARASETKAKASETAAASSASSAKADADRAAGVASSTSWSGDRLTVNGQTSPALTGPQGPAGSSAWADITGKPDLSAKADLVGGKVPTSQLPAVALTKPFVVSDRSAMLKLTAEEGDVAVITSGVDKGTYMLGTGAASAFASWVRLASPDGAVSSVNGQTGVVNLSAADVGAAPVPDFNEVREVVTNFLLTATPNPTPDVVVTRGQFGTSRFADPREAQDAATKNYVDQRTPKIQVVSAMPSTPDASTLYVVV